MTTLALIFNLGSHLFSHKKILLNFGGCILLYNLTHLEHFITSELVLFNIVYFLILKLVNFLAVIEHINSMSNTYSHKIFTNEPQSLQNLLFITSIKSRSCFV